MELDHILETDPTINSPVRSEGEKARVRLALFAGASIAVVSIIAFVLLNNSSLLSTAPIWRDVVVYGVPSVGLVAAVGIGYLVARTRKGQRPRVLQFGDPDPHVRIFYVNGVWTDEKSLREDVELLQRHTDFGITAIHNPNRGPWQPIDTILSVRGGRPTPEIQEVADLVFETWREAYDEMRPERQLVHFGHSEGSYITQLALRRVRAEAPHIERVLHIILLAQSACLSGQELASLTHFYGRGDPIGSGLVDPDGFSTAESEGTLVPLIGELHPGDHSFARDLYWSIDAVPKHLRRFRGRPVRPTSLRLSRDGLRESYS